jgi:hypothetical protein
LQNTNPQWIVAPEEKKYIKIGANTDYPHVTKAL